MPEDGLRDRSVILEWYGVPCHCRCRHCLLSSGARVSSVPYQRATGVADKFAVWRKTHAGESPEIHFWAAYCCDFPELPRHLDFCRRLGCPSTYEPINGIRIRSTSEIEDFLRILADAGVKQVNLTFYGMKEFHDRFAGRAGDFEFLLEIARLGPQSGLERSESIYLLSDSLDELPALVEELDRIPGLGSRHVWTCDYRGRAKKLEDQRPTVDEIDRLPASVTRFLDREGQRPETEWVRVVSAGEVPEKLVRNYLIPIWPENVAELESEDCWRILSRLREADDEFHREVPPLEELARLCGDGNGQKVYALRDLEWKWQDAYLADHPDLSHLKPFNDLEARVMRKRR
jgi:hypothetical protein